MTVRGEAFALTANWYIIVPGLVIGIAVGIAVSCSYIATTSACYVPFGAPM
ncbi:MAG TPA: hypothetical protein VFN37_02715 [Candidatus Baltobacteraceae bacterium]|nr:hypothetical protein [Candidatus Baltobacteraceae bacterium]